jgi:hypothetical protein
LSDSVVSIGLVGGCNSSTGGSAIAVAAGAVSALFSVTPAGATPLPALVRGLFVLALGIGQ